MSEWIIQEADTQGRRCDRDKTPFREEPHGPRAFPLLDLGTKRSRFGCRLPRNCHASVKNFRPRRREVPACLRPAHGQYRPAASPLRMFRSSTPRDHCVTGPDALVEKFGMVFLRPSTESRTARLAQRRELPDAGHGSRTDSDGAGQSRLRGEALQYAAAQTQIRDCLLVDHVDGDGLGVNEVDDELSRSSARARATSSQQLFT